MSFKENITKNDVEILSYEEVLHNITNNENHLLLGNGFNYGLGVNTGYKAIFTEMMESGHGLYKDARNLVEACDYDLEKFIGTLLKDIDPNNDFLRKFIVNKVKLDFLRATHVIVKSSIKNIFAEKNQGIFILFSNFTNFFTLNYDSFLYILLLNYKMTFQTEDESVEVGIAFTPQIKFIEDDLNKRQNNLYSEIKELRENGQLIIKNEDNVQTTSQLSKITKTHFSSEVKNYCKAKNKGWESKDIDRVINYIYEEEKKNKILEHVDDGSRQISFFEYEFQNPITQNVFFLHGGFHITEENGSYKKITQRQEKALYEKLEEILNNEEKDIVAIFQSKGKEKVIEQNSYLKFGLNKLNSLIGSMVIIGSSLDENDEHIYREINNSKIEEVYISTLRKEKDKNYIRATELFPSKRVYLFDAETISYMLPDEQK